MKIFDYRLCEMLLNVNCNACVYLGHVITMQLVFSLLEGSVILLNLGLQSLFIIQVLGRPSGKFGNTLEESSAGSWTQTQTETSVMVINNTCILGKRKFSSIIKFSSTILTAVFILQSLKRDRC